MYMQVKTLNIVLPMELVKKVDEQAQKEYRNRSELIREALRVYLMRLEKWEDIFVFGQKMGKKVGIKSENDVDEILENFRHARRSS